MSRDSIYFVNVFYVPHDQLDIQPSVRPDGWNSVLYKRHRNGRLKELLDV